MTAQNGAAGPPERGQLNLRRLGIDTYQEAVIYVNRDSDVCR
jgi:hypothetical protein